MNQKPDTLSRVFTTWRRPVLSPCVVHDFASILLSHRLKMVNKCGVVCCNGNYNAANKCRVFKLPTDPAERQKLIDKIPKREHFEIKPQKFFICERHWPPGCKLVKLPGGTRPSDAPTVWPNVPASCLPTQPLNSRRVNVADVKQRQIEKVIQDEDVR